MRDENMFTHYNYEATADWLRQRLDGFKPELLLVLGSGLGFLADKIENARRLSYKDIPRFKASTAPGHDGTLVTGTLAGKRVMALRGRVHVYEGHAPEETAFPVRVAGLLGVKAMITTCACGGVNTSYKPGDLALLTDIINLTHAGPLVGFDITGEKHRFIDMSHVFDEQLIVLAKETAKRQGLALQEGVYFYTVGPQFETPAEIRAIRTLGGDLVGMSAVHEVIMARRSGIRTLGIALVSNMASGVLNQALSEGEVLEEAEKASAKFEKLLTEVISGME
jgi:purine-nucleoside phosphorylase